MTDTASTEIAYEDLPEGDWYVEARRDDTVARLLFGHKLLPLNGHHMGSPRVVVLTPRPYWVGVEFPEQQKGLRVDGRPTFVEEVPYPLADPIIMALGGEGINAARDALAALLADGT
jgi:hypothetical protein